MSGSILCILINLVFQTRLQFPHSLSEESANPRLAQTGERERMHFQLSLRNVWNGKYFLSKKI